MRKRKNTNDRKRYRVIAKITGEKLPNGKDQCWKGIVHNLITFTNDFLDKKHPNWCWFNVYEYHADRPGIQLASFSNKRRPSTKSL